MKSKKRVRLGVIGILMLTAFAGAGMADQTTYCYSCTRPPKGGLCSINNGTRIGTWGDDVKINGVTFHTCVVPGIISTISPVNSFLGEEKAKAFLELFTVSLAGLHSPQINDCNVAIADYRSQFKSDVRLQNLCTAKRPSTKPTSIVQIDCVPGTPANLFNTGSVISVVVECQ